MRIVPAQDLQNWLAEGRVLERDGRGPKVVALNSGQFLKIFHTRRYPILARLQPAAKRFSRNTERLRKLGIAAPHVTDVFWIDPSTGLSGCLYEPLEGESVEQIFRRDDNELARLLPSLAAFIRQIHQQGVYFRSLHLGNILVLDGGGFGLIDVLDMQFKHGPLGGWRVQRNLQHLSRYLERNKHTSFPAEELLQHYWSKPGERL